jgi:histidinol-phosphatase (PHP family)
MLKTNYHSHCDFCDGKRPASEMALAAFERGFLSFGFSSHAPLPFGSGWHMKAPSLEAYAAEIRRLGRLYEGRMEIPLGLEIDFVEGIRDAGRGNFGGIGLDYAIGSVHYLDPGKTCDPADMFTVDGPIEEFERGLARWYKGRIDALVRDYFAAVRAMIEKGGFDILGHLDLVRKNNWKSRFFDEGAAWYKAELSLTAECLSGRELIVEVNTGGMSRGYTSSPYPDLSALSELGRRGVKATICSDAHEPRSVDAFYLEARDALIAAGYRETSALVGGKWVSAPIDR